MLTIKRGSSLLSKEKKREQTKQNDQLEILAEITAKLIVEKFLKKEVI